ncbi:hypothetical protein A7X89_08860 [Stenotrophomonas maltophilia]|nr:hypothetical protein A7X89_08860 [Stenotrophomonas maltophilia]
MIQMESPMKIQMEGLSRPLRRFISPQWRSVHLLQSMTRWAKFTKERELKVPLGSGWSGGMNPDLRRSSAQRWAV